MKIKKDAHYEIKYPMNIYQQKAHVDAMNRTIAYFKTIGWGVTQKQIVKILAVVHLYIVYLAHKMHKRTGKYESVSKVKIGYFRTIFTKLFVDMRDTGEFTKEEFHIIRNEFYKKEFDKYFEILKADKTWLKQRKKVKLLNSDHQKGEK